MGRLARTGILGGKRVPSRGLISSDVTRRFDPFSRKVFESAGYLGLAQRILHGEALTLDQIEHLLSQAPLAILMKLAEIRVGQPAEVAPRPIVVLPLKGWLSLRSAEQALNAATEFLNDFAYKDLLIVLDSLDTSDFVTVGPECNIGKMLRQLSLSRNGVQFVGPAVEDIVSGLARHQGAQSSVLPSGELASVLCGLVSSGVSLLRTSSKPALLRHVVRAGLPISVKSNLDQFASNRSLAKHFLYLNDLSTSDKLIDFWMPTFSETSPLLPGTLAADVKLLRALAVSAVAMPNIDGRRASSRYLSLSGYHFSRFMGANNFGVGAVNAATSKSLEVPTFEDLHREESSPFDVLTSGHQPLRSTPAGLMLNY